MPAPDVSGLALGYCVMLEKVHPSAALALAQQAESAGFTGTMATDHFQPWLPSHGQSSFVWNVLAALGERTIGDFGPAMAVPGYRYHPVTLAQAAATLSAMYEDRAWVGIGSGEALNEHVVGGYWPEAAERIDRMFEAIELVKKLFAASAAGRDTRFAGRWFQLETTRLWTMPETPPPLLVTTGGPLTARRAGRVADGIITFNSGLDNVAHLLERFADGVREAGRTHESLQRVVQLHLSWAPSHEEAVHHALTHWPTGAMRFAKGDIRSPHVFEQIARLVREDDLDGRLIVSDDPDVHRAEIQRYADLGFDRVYLHNVGPNQQEWIEVFGSQVLPKLRR